MGELSKQQIADVLATAGLKPAGGKIVKAESYIGREGEPRYKVLIDYGPAGVKKVDVDNHDLDVALEGAPPTLESMKREELERIANSLGVTPAAKGKVQLVLAIRAKLTEQATAELGAMPKAKARPAAERPSEPPAGTQPPPGDEQAGADAASGPGTTEGTTETASGPAWPKEVLEALETAKAEDPRALVAMSNDELKALGLNGKQIKAVRKAVEALGS